MILHDSIGNGEPKPGTACFGGVEGVEQAGQRLLGDAHACVPHRKFDPACSVGQARVAAIRQRPPSAMAWKALTTIFTNTWLICVSSPSTGGKSFIDRVFKMNLALLRFELHQRDDMFDDAMNIHFVKCRKSRDARTS